MPLGMLAGLRRKLMPPIIKFGSPAQRAKVQRELFWHVPVTLHPRWRIGPAEVPLCNVLLDIYEDGRRRNSLQMSWGDMLFVDPQCLEHLRANHVSLVPHCWRDRENERSVLRRCAVFAKATRACRPDTGGRQDRFRIRVKSGSFVRQSPHYYLVRSPPAGSTNGLFTLEIEYEGEGTVDGPSLPVAGDAEPVREVPRAKAVEELPISKRAPSPYEVETKLKAIDRALEIVRRDLDAIDKRGPQLCSSSWNGFRNRAAPFEYRDALISYRDQIRTRALELEEWRAQVAHYADLVRATEPTWVQNLISAVDNFITTYMGLHTYLKRGRAIGYFRPSDGPQGLCV